jgi:hypothetical protein
LRGGSEARVRWFSREMGSRSRAVVGNFVFRMRELVPLIDQAATALDARSAAASVCADEDDLVFVGEVGGRVGRLAAPPPLRRRPRLCRTPQHDAADRLSRLVADAES